MWKTRNSGSLTRLMTIDSIEIGSRYRKEMGDLASLAESIRQVGLLQPIGVTEDRRLVFGERRLRVFRDFLRRKRIPVRIVKLGSLTAGEYSENEFRKDFTPSERVAIAVALTAKFGERRGNPSIRHRRDELDGRADDEIARRVSFGSRRTYRDAMKVVERGSPQLIAAMDSGEVSISRAAVLADLPPELQLSRSGEDGIPLAATARNLQARKRLVHEPHEADMQQTAPEAKGLGWSVTTCRTPVPCAAVFVDAAGNFNSNEECCWAAWTNCGADHFALFCEPDRVFHWRRLLDRVLGGYRFARFFAAGQCPDDWTAILLYARVGGESRCRRFDGIKRRVGMNAANDNEANVLRWLIEALTERGETVCSLFADKSAIGMAALSLGRNYHGVVANEMIRDCLAVHLRARSS